MDLFTARNLALQLMAQHGLAGWSFAFDHAKRRFGSCHCVRKRITLSKHLTFLNAEDEVRDTLLHEIAHALTPGDGHGPRWRAACLRIGAKPQRCYRDTQVVSPPRKPAPYLLGCTHCGWWVDRHKRSRHRLICRTCRGPVIMRTKIPSS